MSSVISIPRDCRQRPRCRAVVPCVRNLNPNFVVSGTLHRVYKVQTSTVTQLTGPRRNVTVLSVVKGPYTYVAVAPTAAMLAAGCDACTRRHSALNVECMANTPESLKHVCPGQLYRGRVRVSHRLDTPLTFTRGRRVVTVLLLK